MHVYFHIPSLRMYLMCKWRRACLCVQKCIYVFTQCDRSICPIWVDTGTAQHSPYNPKILNFMHIRSTDLQTLCVY